MPLSMASSTMRPYVELLIGAARATRPNMRCIRRGSRATSRTSAFSNELQEFAIDQPLRFNEHMKKPLVIIGSGGFAREAFSWLPQDYQVEAFFSNLGVVEQSLFGIPVIRDLDGMRDTEFLVAVGDPKTRWNLWRSAIQAGLYPCKPIVHPTAVVGRDCRIGNGSILCPQSVVTTNVEIGLGFILNLSATIGHDCKIEDFVTVSPGANISGNVQIGELAYIGTGASIREKISIESESTVGMGAVVTKNVPRGVTFIGNPARQMSR